MFVLVFILTPENPVLSSTGMNGYTIAEQTLAAA